MLLRRSMALRQVMDRSQVRNCESPRKVPSFRYAVTNASCATSSASAGERTAARAARNTARRFRSTSSPNASVSPAWARRTRARSRAVAASAASVTVTRLIEGSGGTRVGKSRMEPMLNSEQLLAAIRDKVEHPATARELLQRLKISHEPRATVNRLLKGLVAAGHLVQTRGNHFGLPDRMNLVVGRVQTHPRGFG